MNPLDSLLAWLFPEPPKLIDPEFGLLINTREDTWRSEGDIAFGDDQVGVTFVAGRDGPTTAQRKSLRDLRERWPELRAILEEQVFDEVRDWFDGARRGAEQNGDSRYLALVPVLTTPDQVWSHLDLDYVNIPKEGDDQADYSIGFEVLYNDGEPDPEHVLNIEIKDWRIVFSGIEG